MSKIRIYIASPYGFSEAGRFFLYKKLIPAVIECGLECIDPWSLTSSNIIDSASKINNFSERCEAWGKVNRIIAENNKRGIEDASGLLAILDGTDVDSGTAAEIGYAAAHDKIIVGYRGDFRKTGDNDGSQVNLQVEYFIFNSGGRIVHSLEELKCEFKRLFNVL